MKNIRSIFELCLALLLIGLGSYAGLAQQTAQSHEQQPPPAAFGYDIFRALPEPIVEGPVDEDYLISPGDEIIISVWGQLNLKHALTVSEDGFIELPDEGGRVFTNGVSLRESKRLITESLSRIYSSYINIENPGASTAFVDVKLGKVRKLLVYVMGEVKSQGTYTISSAVATILNLLNNAGGVKETGSLREIRIRRADGTIDVVDLYDLLITGKMDTKKNRVRYGDYIIVPLKAKSATIKGEVKRPGIYQFVPGMTVKDLVEQAEGLKEEVYLDRADLVRTAEDFSKKLTIFSLKDLYKEERPGYYAFTGNEEKNFNLTLVEWASFGSLLQAERPTMAARWIIRSLLFRAYESVFLSRTSPLMKEKLGFET